MKVGDWIQGSPGDKNGRPVPGKVYVIRKDGRRKRDGGAGVIWTCSCPHGRHVKPCSHLRRIFDQAKDGALPKQLRLTVDGQRAAGRCGCIKKANDKAPPRHPRSWLRPKATATPHPKSWVHRKKPA